MTKKEIKYLGGRVIEELYSRGKILDDNTVIVVPELVGYEEQELVGYSQTIQILRKYKESKVKVTIVSIIHYNKACYEVELKFDYLTVVKKHIQQLINNLSPYYPRIKAPAYLYREGSKDCGNSYVSICLFLNYGRLKDFYNLAKDEDYKVTRKGSNITLKIVKSSANIPPKELGDVKTISLALSMLVDDIKKAIKEGKDTVNFDLSSHNDDFALQIADVFYRMYSLPYTFYDDIHKPSIPKTKDGKGIYYEVSANNGIVTVKISYYDKMKK